MSRLLDTDTCDVLYVDTYVSMRDRDHVMVATYYRVASCSRSKFVGNLPHPIPREETRKKKIQLIQESNNLMHMQIFVANRRLLLVYYYYYHSPNRLLCTVLCALLYTC